MRWESGAGLLGVQVTAYLGCSSEDVETQDALVAFEGNDRLVLAVADGVTPTSDTPWVDDCNGARFAALHVLQHVCDASAFDSLETAFYTANAGLFSRFGGLSSSSGARDLPQAAAAALDIRFLPGGALESASAVQAADCDVWWRTGSRWIQGCQRQMLVGEARAWLALWDLRNPTASCWERVREETRWLNDIEYWNMTALGRFAQPKLQTFDVPAPVEELALVTDGVQFANFVERDGHDLDGWMRQLRTWERVRTCDAPRHSDAALLRVRFG